MEDGVKTIMGPIPAIKFDETTGWKIWFNSMVAAYTGWMDALNDPVKAVTFGDGTPLPADIIDDCLKILEEESVAIPWQQGDILLLDNLAVLHSRQSFDPPRRILLHYVYNGLFISSFIYGCTQVLRATFVMTQALAYFAQK